MKTETLHKRTQYAVLVRASGKWITHLVFDDAREAYAECGSLVHVTKQFAEQDTCVRIYHSHAWELLVR